MDVTHLVSALCFSLPWVSCTGADPNGGQVDGGDRLNESAIAAQEADLPIEISRETTYFTKPRMADGRVDYAAAINRINSRGVTPEDNASILMLQAFGPELLDLQWRDEYYQRVGMEPLAPDGQWFVDIREFAQQRGIDREPELDPELEPFREELMEMIRKGGGDASEHPELFQALMELARRPVERPRTLADHLDDATRKVWTAEDYPHLAGWLEVNQEPLELVVAASLRSKRFDPVLASDDEPWISTGSPVSLAFTRAGIALAARSTYRLGSGEVDRAIDDILACYRLAVLCGLGDGMAHVTRGSHIASVATGSLEALLNRSPLSPEQSRKIHRALSELDEPRANAEIFGVYERAFALAMVQRLVWEAAPEGKLLDDWRRRVSPLGPCEQVPLPILTDVMRRLNAKYDELVLVLQIDDFAQRQQRNNELWDDFQKTVERYTADAQLVAMAARLGSNLRRSLEPYASRFPLAGMAAQGCVEVVVGEIVRQRATELVTDGVVVGLITNLLPYPAILDQSRLRWLTERRLVTTALAIEQFRRRHGRLPGELDELLPESLAELPLDPFTGQSLYYRPQNGGYLLYSTGPNRRDNGGARWQDAPRRFTDGDVVIEIRP